MTGRVGPDCFANSTHLLTGRDSSVGVSGHCVDVVRDDDKPLFRSNPEHFRVAPPLQSQISRTDEVDRLATAHPRDDALPKVVVGKKTRAAHEARFTSA